MRNSLKKARSRQVNYFWVKMEGKSMAPTIKPGVYMSLEKVESNNLQEGDIIVFRYIDKVGCPRCGVERVLYFHEDQLV